MCRPKHVTGNNLVLHKALEVNNLLKTLTKNRFNKYLMSNSLLGHLKLGSVLVPFSIPDQLQTFPYIDRPTRIHANLVK